MEIRKHARKSVTSLVSVMVAALAVCLWSACTTPGKKTAMTPMAPQPAKEMAAAPAASPAPDAGSKTAEQAPSAAAISADKSLPLNKLKGVLQSFVANLREFGGGGRVVGGVVPEMIQPGLYWARFPSRSATANSRSGLVNRASTVPSRTTWPG